MSAMKCEARNQTGAYDYVDCENPAHFEVVVISSVPIDRENSESPSTRVCYEHIQRGIILPPHTVHNIKPDLIGWFVRPINQEP